MRKGLLHRRRMMQASGGMDYIREGLILWLDGIEKENYSALWTDLVNGISFTNAGGAIMHNDHFQFDGTNSSYFFHSDLSLSRDSTTIEIVASRNANAWMSVFVSGGDNGNIRPAGIRFNTNNVIGIDSLVENSQSTPFYYSTVNLIGYKVTISANLDQAYINKVKCTTTGAVGGYSTIGNAVIGGRWWLGSFYSTGRFIGDLYCLRVYNRRLTEEEMLHNQQVDNIRFNLGLTL